MNDSDLIYYKNFIDACSQIEASAVWSSWLDKLPTQVRYGLYERPDGHRTDWFKGLERLSHFKIDEYDLKANTICLGSKRDAQDRVEELRDILMSFHPWRKGPFEVMGTMIDTEWRSDWKWQRVKELAPNFNNQTVLDVGSGNGYYGLRCLGEGATLVMGIDPTLLYTMQFLALNTLLNINHMAVLPVGIDDMPYDIQAFDNVMSMGLLYHRRSPLDHILHLKSALKSGGRLIIETLVVEGDNNHVLCPNGRYANMPHVWFIPSIGLMCRWLQRLGLEDIQAGSPVVTTEQEQRQTEWMRFHSLKNFLNPHDKTRTLEGYPAPLRCVFQAVKP